MLRLNAVGVLVWACALAPFGANAARGVHAEPPYPPQTSIRDQDQHENRKQSQPQKQRAPVLTPDQRDRVFELYVPGERGDDTPSQGGERPSRASKRPRSF